MRDELFKTKKRGRKSGTSPESFNVPTETKKRVALRAAASQANTLAGIERARAQDEQDAYYGALGFDNPVKAASGLPAVSFVYGSGSHNHSHS